MPLYRDPTESRENMLPALDTESLLDGVVDPLILISNILGWGEEGGRFSVAA